MMNEIKLLTPRVQESCPHPDDKIVVQIMGGLHSNAGEVTDDIQHAEVCTACGKELGEDWEDK